MVLAVPTLSGNGMMYPILTKHDKIDYLALETITMELFSNSHQVPSYRGNGLLGHAYIVLGQIEYTRIAGVAFTHPSIRANRLSIAPTQTLSKSRSRQPTTPPPARNGKSTPPRHPS